MPLDAIRRPRDTLIWKLDQFVNFSFFNNSHYDNWKYALFNCARAKGPTEPIGKSPSYD
jgi:hypothetical protein